MCVNDIVEFLGVINASNGVKRIPDSEALSSPQQSRHAHRIPTRPCIQELSLERVRLAELRECSVVLKRHIGQSSRLKLHGSYKAVFTIVAARQEHEHFVRGASGVFGRLKLVAKPNLDIAGDIVIEARHSFLVERILIAIACEDLEFRMPREKKLVAFGIVHKGHLRNPYTENCVIQLLGPDVRRAGLNAGWQG